MIRSWAGLSGRLVHNGVPVHVPPGQTSSGMAMISAGDLEAARMVAERNVRELAELAREGCPIVCTEPSSALCLKYEYPMILNHPDVDVVASKVVDAGAVPRGDPSSRPAQDRFPAARSGCGLSHALPSQGTRMRHAAGQSPLFDSTNRLHRIEKGCSGMAGAYGLTERNFATSIRIGWGLITRTCAIRT